MSSVFKSPKKTVVKQVSHEEVVPETVDDNLITLELEKKRKKKMGAISQMIAHDNTYSGLEDKKTTLGA